MLDQYDFLREEGFRGVFALPAKSSAIIEGVVDLWVDLEGEIPRDRNVFHELFAKYSDKWFEYLRLTRPDLTSLIRGWWLELARIRHNDPSLYRQRHIRRDWYGHAEDPRPYSGKIFILPLGDALGLKEQPSEEYYDRFHKILKAMVWDDIFTYDTLRLWPQAEYGVRDIDVNRAKVCPVVIIGTEKLIGEPQLKLFSEVYGVTVRTSVFKKPSTLSDWAVISELVVQLRGRDLPILLVTLADYDFDGITGVHLAFKDHFAKYYPEVEHAICGVFPFQIPEERLTPGDALYELGAKPLKYWQDGIKRGTIPADMEPYEYKGKFYADQTINYLVKAEAEGYIGEDSYEYLGLAFSELGDYERSAESFLRAVDQEPTDMRYLALAQSHFNLGHTSEAEEYLMRTLDTTSDFDVEIKTRFLLGKIYFETDQMTRSEDQYKSILQDDPLSADAYYFIGEIYLKYDKIAEARYYWRQAYNIDPSHYGARLRLF